MMRAETVANRLGEAYLSAGGWWRARCPAHGSAGPTLALRATSSQGLLVFCHAGCRHDDIIEELERLGLLDGDGEHVGADPAEIERQRADDERRRQQRIAQALDIWRHETTAPDGTA